VTVERHHGRASASAKLPKLGRGREDASLAVLRGPRVEPDGPRGEVDVPPGEPLDLRDAPAGPGTEGDEVGNRGGEVAEDAAELLVAQEAFPHVLLPEHRDVRPNEELAGLDG